MTVRMLSRAPSAPSSGSGAAASFTPLESHDFAARSTDAAASSFQAPGNGVVVVGVVGKAEEDLSQLLDRVLDARIFGSAADARNGIVDQVLSESRLPAFAHKQLCWMKNRLKHYHDEEKGVIYVMFSWASLPLDLLSEEDLVSVGLPSLLEQHEMTGLRGLLFMFSVCHIVLLVQEGACLEPKLLRVFRILQAAKSAMSSFMKSQVLPAILPASLSKGLRGSQTSGRVGMGGRHISLMSGGSSPTLFPGQCIPVLLFIFLEDFSDGLESTDSLMRRTGNKPEAGFRKKFQSSVEAQVRFLIRKCRTVLGFGDGHGGSSGIGTRGPSGAMGATTGGALFTMDPSRVVLFVERCGNRPCRSLEATTNILEDMLAGKLDPGALWNSGSSVLEDIQNIKDFLWKQSETLRGRGGNTGASGGVGMVAAAAAAAAASAAAGATGAPSKTVFSPPELPSISSWLLACNMIIGAVMTSESEAVKFSERPRNQRKSLPAPVDRTGKGGIEAALGCLDCGMGLNMSFSASWCKKVLPSARELYLKGLPTCYPSQVHKRQLERAVSAFRSMVRGPAVSFYASKLQEECEAVWRSGRQLCDAVSLTGRPCTHQVHQGLFGENAEKDAAKPHSSGIVFLSACACGRSRRLREDPFDYETANSGFFQFPKCEELLQSMVLPQTDSGSAMEASSWSLLRLGSAAYYNPAVGLLQAGFCADRNVLSRCDIPFSSKTGDRMDAESRDNVPGVEAVVDRSPVVLRNIQHKHVTRGRAVEESKLQPSREQKQEAPRITEESAFPPLPQRNAALPKTGKLPRKEVPKSELAKQELPHKEDGENNGIASGQEITAVAKPSTANENLMEAAVYVGFEHECARGHRFFLSLEHLQKLGSPYSQQPGVEKKQPQKRSKTRLQNRFSTGDAGKPNRFQERATEFTSDIQNGEFAGEGRTLMNSDLPIFMECPYCKTPECPPGGNFAEGVSRLQRIFMVTPPFPLLFACCPVVQLDESAVPSHFSFGCEVVLPPDSFLVLRLPFVYCTKTEDGSRVPLLHKADRPEHTAWLAKGTAYYLLSDGSSAA